jgi:hypothetical protein
MTSESLFSASPSFTLRQSPRLLSFREPCTRRHENNFCTECIQVDLSTYTLYACPFSSNHLSESQVNCCHFANTETFARLYMLKGPNAPDAFTTHGATNSNLPPSPESQHPSIKPPKFSEFTVSTIPIDWSTIPNAEDLLGSDVDGCWNCGAALYVSVTGEYELECPECRLPN